jgi:mRNA interferase MazF
MKNIMRGEIYYADLSPAIGSEQGGTRPVVVIQNNVGNHYSPTIIVAVLTSKQKKNLPTHIEIPCNESNLSMDSTVLLEQVRTIDKSRLENYVGSVTEEKMQEINYAMLVSLGLGTSA